MLDLIHAWLLFPVVMVLLCAGIGLLIERVAGETVPGILVLPLGLAGLVSVAAFTTYASATAPATPVVVGLLALVGLVLGRRAHRPALTPSLTMIAVLLAFGAPVLLSGEAGFAGYLRLDDTATWLAFSDQVMSAGRSLDDLPSATFLQLMKANVSIGYPLGGFTALGSGSRLAGLDAAWAFAPYLAFSGALVAAGLWSIVTPVIPSTRVRALVVFAAAQPALLFSYVQWGGIKEISIAGILL
ncbi:MAG: hypothetical protein Q7T55_18675, partial [Solirubrobacteraceae bacterium]|nr:hypothetical protein [Solirubrobacteraceae bacterium]